MSAQVTVTSYNSQQVKVYFQLKGMRSTAGRRNEGDSTTPPPTQVDWGRRRMRRLRGETCLERWKHIAATASISGVLWG